MKREIKFRVWDNVDYMSSAFTLNDLQTKKIGFTKDCIIMQYTGLKDKNGVEIYEGDILSNGLGINKVCKYGEYRVKRFMNGDLSNDRVHLGFYLHNTAYDRKIQGDTIYYEEECIVINDTFKVIGNIHENPNLLTN